MSDNQNSINTRKKRFSGTADFFKRLVKEKKLGTFGAIITLLLLFTGLFADFLAPYGMNQTYVGEELTAPSAQFWFGTDKVGRDILSRKV